MRRVVPGIKLLLLGLWSLALIPLQMLALRFAWPVLHLVPIFAPPTWMAIARALTR